MSVSLMVKSSLRMNWMTVSSMCLCECEGAATVASRQFAVSRSSDKKQVPGQLQRRGTQT
eukprot:6201515-Amphidinium_carterae.1